MSASQGASDKLAYVNDAGHAIMKVDNTSQVSFNDNRNSVRITTNDRYAVGSLWLVDMVHVPFGVWNSIRMSKLSFKLTYPDKSVLFGLHGGQRRQIGRREVKLIRLKALTKSRTIKCLFILNPYVCFSLHATLEDSSYSDIMS